MVFLCPVLAFFLLGSCSARINGSLGADGSATMTISSSMGDRMSSLIKSMAAAGGQAGGNILDGAAISKSIANSQGIASVSFRNTAPSAIEGTVRISKIGDFLSGASAGGRGFVAFEQGTPSSGGQCSINLDISSGPEIIKMLSPEIEGYLKALMAPIVTQEKMTKKEYLELIEIFYNKAVSDEIAASRVRASIEFPGTITSVKGGTYSGRKADFDIALADLLVLENPVSLEVRWR